MLKGGQQGLGTLPSLASRTTWWYIGQYGVSQRGGTIITNMIVSFSEYSCNHNYSYG